MSTRQLQLQASRSPRGVCIADKEQFARLRLPIRQAPGAVWAPTFATGDRALRSPRPKPRPAAENGDHGHVCHRLRLKMLGLSAVASPRSLTGTKSGTTTVLDLFAKVSALLADAQLSGLAGLAFVVTCQVGIRNLRAETTGICVAGEVVALIRAATPGARLSCLASAQCLAIFPRPGAAAWTVVGTRRAARCFSAPRCLLPPRWPEVP